MVTRLLRPLGAIALVVSPETNLVVAAAVGTPDFHSHHALLFATRTGEMLTRGNGQAADHLFQLLDPPL
jgi:hypothetical protein